MESPEVQIKKRARLGLVKLDDEPLQLLARITGPIRRAKAGHDSGKSGGSGQRTWARGALGVEARASTCTLPPRFNC